MPHYGHPVICAFDPLEDPPPSLSPERRKLVVRQWQQRRRAAEANAHLRAMVSDVTAGL